MEFIQYIFENFNFNQIIFLLEIGIMYGIIYILINLHKKNK